MLVAVVSTRDQHGPVPASAAASSPTERSDHSVELARDQQTLAALPPATTSAISSASGIVTGVDTPRGWQVQSHRDLMAQDPAVGDHQVLLVCVGRGSLAVDVTVSTVDGTELSRQSFPADCSASGATAAASFSVTAEDSAYSVQVSPGAEAVAVVGYRVT